MAQFPGIMQETQKPSGSAQLEDPTCGVAPSEHPGATLDGLGLVPPSTHNPGLESCPAGGRTKWNQTGSAPAPKNVSEPKNVFV